MCACLLRTCTIEFSGIGVMVLKVFLICSTQRGTYFSNSMVRWALSVWCSRWSIQLATYLSNKPRYHLISLCWSNHDLNQCLLSAMRSHKFTLGTMSWRQPTELYKVTWVHQAQQMIKKTIQKQYCTGNLKDTLILWEHKLCDSRVPAQVLVVNIENSCSGHSRRSGRL